MSQSRINQPRRCGSFGGGVCEQEAEMYESWRCDPRSSMRLGESGLEQLFTYLNQTFYVTPRRTCQIQGDFPVLTITPIELFRHMLARFEGERWSNDHDDRAERPAFFEIFGGAALAVCHADRCENMDSAAVRRPTDLDARFYISNHCFDSCRAKVEDYLHLKLIQTVSSGKHNLDNLIAPSMIRFVYFQKQAVVGDAFSLLSIGDSDTGLNIDLEFAYIGNGVRKYFDESNAGVIPLTLEQLSGYGPIHALSQTGDVEAMLDLHFRKALVVHSPEEVINGLALYVHAMCDKGQSPADCQTEDYYGQAFCESFLGQCQQLVESGQGPLRFVHSFIRSHFALRPTLAAAAVAQMLVELSTYEEGLWQHDFGVEILTQLVALFCESIMHSLQVNSPANATAAMCWLLLFLSDPTAEECKDQTDAIKAPRERMLQLYPAGEEGRGMLCQVLSKVRCGETWSVCGEVLQQLRRTAARAAGGAWQQTLVEAVCDTVEAGLWRCGGGRRRLEDVLGEVVEQVMCRSAEVASGLLLHGLAPRLEPAHLHATAAKLLRVAPAEACKALAALHLSTAPPAQQPHAARAAVRILQARKYACGACGGHGTARAGQHASDCGKEPCEACGVVDRCIRRLLFNIIPAAPLPLAKLRLDRSPSPPAPPPGPHTPAVPHKAQGPPQPNPRSPSPEEPQGNRSPSPDAGSAARLPRMHRPGGLTSPLAPPPRRMSDETPHEKRGRRRKERDGR